jgi:signal transduction histidine kinase
MHDTLLSSVANYSVLLGDLPCHTEIICAQSSCKDVHEQLILHPALPGLMIVNADDPSKPVLLGLVARNQFLELCSKPFWIDIHGTRTIASVLKRYTQPPLVMRAHDKIDDAMNRILARSVKNFFEPIVVLDAENRSTLVETHTVMTQMTKKYAEQLSLLNEAHSQLVMAVESKLQAQQAINESLQIQSKLMQSQLIQSEKMAALGQLVASVTHEINTPIGAIQSSGSSISDALSEMLDQLPALILQLDPQTIDFVLELLHLARQPKIPMSSKEERVIVKKAAERIGSAGCDNARSAAVLLVGLHPAIDIEKFIPLLQHPKAPEILQAVGNLSMMISGTRNVNLAVQRVTKIVKALKSFSHFNQSQEKTEASLVEGVETVLTIYQGQTKVGVEVVRNYDDIPPIVCLADELNQVWTNLIHNALQAMNHQGTLTLGIHHIHNEAVVSVTDTGCGIPEDIRSKIFDVFFTTKPAGVGSGLGLDIVKKIIQKHHGRIDVQSQVGQGTTFTVYLPYDQV